MDVDDLINLIIEQATHRGRLCIVIDGINECSDSQGLLEALKTILTSTSGVQLLVASINERNIEQQMRSMPKLYELTVSAEKIGGDISLLVYSALETNPRLQSLPQGLKDDVVVRLTKGADGM